MKITVITGSAHRNGTSALLADKFIEGAKEAGHEVFRFDAALKNVHGCIGCNACITKGKGCVYKDDMEELNPHLMDADVIVFVTPIYYYNINSQIKSVIDRFYVNNSALQCGKKTMLLLSMADTSTDSAEAAMVFFNHFAKFMNWENLGILASTGSWTRADIEKSDSPQKAYEWGRAL